MVQHVQEQIWLAMRRASMTHEQLAERIGCSRPTVSKALSGPDIGMVMADKICAALDLEISGVDGLRLVPRTCDEP
jgi:transcriptional regulator with XRE-family HTH domain